MALTTDYAKSVIDKLGIDKSGIERNRKEAITSGLIAPLRGLSAMTRPGATSRPNSGRRRRVHAAGVTMSHACESFEAGFTRPDGRKRSSAPVIRVASGAPSLYCNNPSDRAIRHFKEPRNDDPSPDPDRR